MTMRSGRSLVDFGVPCLDTGLGGPLRCLTEAQAYGLGTECPMPGVVSRQQTATFSHPAGRPRKREHRTSLIAIHRTRN